MLMNVSSSDPFYLHLQFLKIGWISKKLLLREMKNQGKSEELLGLWREGDFNLQSDLGPTMKISVKEIQKVNFEEKKTHKPSVKTFYI